MIEDLILFPWTTGQILLNYIYSKICFVEFLSCISNFGGFLVKLFVHFFKINGVIQMRILLICCMASWLLH